LLRSRPQPKRRFDGFIFEAVEGTCFAIWKAACQGNTEAAHPDIQMQCAVLGMATRQNCDPAAIGAAPEFFIVGAVGVMERAGGSRFLRPD